MSDRRGDAARRTGVTTVHVTPPDPAADQERILLLECRLEQMRTALAAARAEADEVRTRLAEITAREAENARRTAALYDELAEARTEIAVLHRHVERSEALRAEVEGRLFEARPDADGRELARLRGRQRSAEERALNQERIAGRLRARVEELLASRDTLLARMAEWQQLVREDGPEAADLSEFVAELRREILDLEQRALRAEAREATLREQLALRGGDPEDGIDGADALETDALEADDAAAPVPDAPAAAEIEDAEPAHEVAADLDAPEPIRRVAAERETAPPVSAETAPTPPVSAEIEEDAPPSSAPGRTAPFSSEAGDRADRIRTTAAELEASRTTSLRSALLLRLGRSGGADAIEVVRPWTSADEAAVRASAYEALARLLEDRPEELEPVLREGLADEDARVRRRVALGVTTARRVEAHVLLAPLADDPDPQLRRLVRQTLARARARGDGMGPAMRPAAVAGRRPVGVDA